MKLITKDIDYAVRALLHILKSKNKTVSVGELEKETKISRSFLRKILQTLSREKILKSIKGKGGGFSLNKPPEKVFLKDLIKIFQGKISFINCIFRGKPCFNRKTCPLRKKIKKIEKYVEGEIKGVSLQSLADNT